VDARSFLRLTGWLILELYWFLKSKFHDPQYSKKWAICLKNDYLKKYSLFGNKIIRVY